MAEKKDYWLTNMMTSDSKYNLNKRYLRMLGVINTIIIQEMIEGHFINKDNGTLELSTEGEYWFTISLEHIKKAFCLTNIQITKSIKYLSDLDLVYEAYKKPKSKSKRYFSINKKEIARLLTEGPYYEE